MAVGALTLAARLLLVQQALLLPHSLVPLDPLIEVPAPAPAAQSVHAEVIQGYCQIQSDQN